MLHIPSRPESIESLIDFVGAEMLICRRSKAIKKSDDDQQDELIIRKIEVRFLNDCVS